MSTSILARTVVELGLDSDKLNKGADNAIGRMKKLGGSITSAGKGLTAAFTLPAIAAVGGLLAIGSAHDSMVDTIRVGTGKVGADLEALDKTAQNVFSSIPTSMELTGQAVTQLNQRTGATGVVLEDLARTELELARITGGDLGQTIESTTRLFGDWGINVNDGSAALDELFRASQATGVPVDALAESMVKFGSPMRQLGFDFETAAALIGKFEKEGVNTELVLGSLRIALGKMAKEGIDDPKAALAALVKGIKDAGSVGEANALALEAFGARAGPDMAAAIREGRFDVDELFNTMMNGEDTILDAAAATNDWRENLQILQNRIATKLIPVADKLFAALNEKGIPLLERLADTAEDIIKWFDKMPRGVKVAAAAFGILLAALGPVLVIVGTIIGAIAPAIPVIAAIAGAISLPLLAVIGVIVLLAIAWRKNWFDIRGKTKAAIAYIWGVINPFVQKFLKATETIRYGISRIAKAFKAGGIRGAIDELFGKGGAAILTGLGRIFGLVPRLIGQFLRNIRTGFGPLDAIFHNLGAMFQDVGLLIQNIFAGNWGKAFDIAVDLFKRFLNQYRLVGELLLGIFNAIPWSTIGNALWTGFVAAVSFLVDTGIPWLWDKSRELLSTIREAFDEIYDSKIKPFMAGVPGKLVNLIAAGNTLLYNAGRTALGWLWTGIASLWNWVLGQFSNLPGALYSAIAWAGWMFFNFGRDIVSSIWNGIASLWNWLLGQISNLPGAIWDQLNNVPGHSPMDHAAAEIGRSAMTGIAEGIKAGSKQVLNAAANARKNIYGAMSGDISISGSPRVAESPAMAGLGGASTAGARTATFAAGAIVVYSDDGEKVAGQIVRALDRKLAGAH